MDHRSSGAYQNCSSADIHAAFSAGTMARASGCAVRWKKTTLRVSAYAPKLLGISLSPRQLGVAPSPRQLGVVLSPQKMVQSGSGSPGQLSPSRHSSGCLWTVNAIATRRKRNPSPQERLLDQVDALSDAAGQKVLLQLRRELEDEAIRFLFVVGLRRPIFLQTRCSMLQNSSLTEHLAYQGAISVTNNHQNELFVETIVLQGLPFGTVYFGCYSWVQSKFRTARERIFFANKRYLPSETPPGLIDLRERNKASLRGKGTGTRKPWESVYDYDVYNDIGNPDKSIELSRPTIGGSRAFPYPRRCRTGRLPTKIDATAESVLAMNESYYVPRDEVFQEMKRETFKGKNLLGVVHQITPAMTKSLHESHEEFQSFQDIDRLYQEGIILRDFEHKDELLKVLNISQITHKIEASINYGAGIMQYAKPDILSKDHFAWLRDDEFGRQMLSGANPVQIQRLQEFPPKSSDLDAYGDSLSAFKDEHLAGRLEGLSVEEAINQERLFILDYHDAFLPFVNRVNELPGRKMYASRTILFLTGTGSLIPLAIELSLPEQKRVFTPGSDASSDWLWQLAKAHVSSNDAGFHQLVNHWLRSHAAVEPYIIATRRQLSSMHPLYVLLQLHFKCTLEINALARQLLINADGVIENCFTAGPFGLEISSAAYSSMWKFDQESLPNDLMRRGMAVKDPSQPHGIRLIIQDYPYGSDGLLIWDAITTWVEEYVSLFYKDSKSVEEDAELQAWWEEIRMVGHADKKDAEWWPSLRTTDNLKAILTTILWVVSGFHAAVNFAQYAYGGYVPNRPCMTRRLIPEEGSEEYREFLEDPERFFISMLPNVQQATTTMSVIDTLSSHSPDEEYLGERMQTNWTNNLAAQEAFKRFSQQMDLIEHIITLRNKDLSLNNRSGAGVLPYEILCPSSAPGTTSRGVPNSVSI